MNGATLRRCLAAAAVLAFGSSCSDLRDQPLAPSGPAAKVHPEGWVSPADPTNFHGQAVRQAGWDFSGCTGCHGEDYAGDSGSDGVSCLTCHPSTPENCDVCHGSSDNFAPPEDTHGRSDTSFGTVGAHQAHVREGSLRLAIECSECHLVPATFDDPAHIDGDGRAEITFGELASTGDRRPTFDPETRTCADTYCHEGGSFGNDGRVVVWNEVGTGQADCGTCHTLPPPPETDHPALALCNVCHFNVVDADIAILDRSLHMNGQTDF